MGTEKANKPLAYQLYIGSDLKRYQIAEQANCTEKTLRGWIEKGNWDQIRNSRNITKPELLQSAYKQLASVQRTIDEDFKGVPTKALADALSSISRIIEKLSDQPVHRYIEVLDDLTAWIGQNQPDKLKEIAVILGDYTQHLAQKIGK